MNALRSAVQGLVAVTLAACGAGTPVDTGTYVVAPVGDPSATTRFDPATIEEVRVEGDRLHLRVTFGGGCRQHDFGLRFERVFLESEPVQSVLRLAHDAHGDPCRALLGRDLEFDLGPLKELYREAYGSPSGTIDLRVYPPGGSEPHPERVRYTF